MGKIVGKQILLVVGMLLVHSLAANITLRLLDIDRAPLTQVGAGHPFILDVMVTDVSTIGQMPTVQGIDQHVAKNSGMRISSVNGKTTANYSFELRIDKPGTYTIGPALLTDRGTQIRSNIVNVVVGDQQLSATASSNTKKTDAPILLRLTVDKTKLVVGEQMRCSLRFYYTNPDISLRQFIEQESANWRRSKADEPVTGAQSMNGIDYNYVEWSWNSYAKTAGDLTIPAYGVDYERKVDRDDFWGGFGRIFGSHVETKRVYSNGLTIHVDPLPVSKEPLNAIGHFSSFSICAQPSVARQAEGIVVSLDLIGDGDPELVTINGLTQVPSALKYYESKRTVTPYQDGKQNSIHLEYIVQGLQPGTWQIPPQSFYYFDTKKRSFNTLSTTPLSLGILPNNRSIQDVPRERTDQLALHLHGVQVAGAAHMPWWLFFVLFMIPCIVLSYRYSRVAIRKKWQQLYGFSRTAKAFTNAKQRLDLCKKTGRYQDLYKLFIEYFADRWHQSLGTLTDETIMQRLQASGMANNELKEWQQFFTTITHYAFTLEPLTTDNHLFTHAERWIQRLEKLR